MGRGAQDQRLCSGRGGTPPLQRAARYRSVGLLLAGPIAHRGAALVVSETRNCSVAPRERSMVHAHVYGTGVQVLPSMPGYLGSLHLVMLLLLHAALLLHISSVGRTCVVHVLPNIPRANDTRMTPPHAQIPSYYR